MSQKLALMLLSMIPFTKQYTVIPSSKCELNDVSHIANGVAVIHSWSRFSSGSAHLAGQHEVDTLILAVLTRQDDLWLIQALEKVTLTNPRTGEMALREK
ncbi:hypothetical protein [Vibrio eleionomae]|uniref:hypothetical protein n=1 Tax=Vibrio eleionomae TaxID=2653505 RepID=UPI0019272700|nr:hypothetical protein [Vibrio eleionomae]